MKPSAHLEKRPLRGTSITEWGRAKKDQRGEELVLTSGEKDTQGAEKGSQIRHLGVIAFHHNSWG